MYEKSEFMKWVHPNQNGVLEMLVENMGRDTARSD